MPPNPDLVRTRAADIRQAVGLLRHAARRPLVDLESDDDFRDATLYRLRLAIGGVMALCSHLAATLPTRAPGSMPDCFRAVAQETGMDEELARRLGMMARFRNLLLHRYWHLELSRVHAYLREDLGDFEAWLAHVSTVVREAV